MANKPNTNKPVSILAFEGTELTLYCDDSSGGTKTITINLPEEFADASEVYYVDVTKDKLLISANNTNVGIWLYNIHLNQLTQIHNTGYNFKYFQQLTDTVWMISSATYTDGVYKYDEINDTIIQIYNRGYEWTYWHKVTDTKWLASSDGNFATGMWVYHLNTDTFVKLLSTDSTYRVKSEYVYKLSNEIWLYSSGASASHGLYQYNTVTDEVIKLTNYGGYCDLFIKVNNKYMLCSSSTNSTYLLQYDLLNNTATQLSESVSVYKYIRKITEVKWLITSTENRTATNGIHLYNAESGELTRIYTEGYGLGVVAIIENKVLLSTLAYSSNNLGILLYNTDDDTVTQIYSTGQQWKFAQRIGSKCLISSAYTSGGILLYNADDDTVTQIYSIGKNWQYFQLINDKCLINTSEGSSNGILVYSSIDDSIIKTIDGYEFSNFKITNNDKCLMTSKSQTALYLYNYVTNTTVAIRNGTKNCDIFIEQNNNYYISASDKTKNPRTILYNSTDDSTKLVKCDIEVN